MKNLLTAIILSSSLNPNALLAQETPAPNLEVFSSIERSQRLENLSGEIDQDITDQNYPWLNGANNSGDNTHIYIPDNYDYQLIQQMMSGSGFGPGNGGNQYIFEADSLVKKIISALKANADQFPEVSAEDFAKEAPKVGLFFVNGVPGDEGRILDAANFPREKAILINVKNWRALNGPKKTALLFHEYLGIMGIERENTHISSRLLNFIEFKKNGVEFDAYKLRYLYSRSNTDTDAIEISFANNQTGQYSSRYGSDTFTWKKIDNGINLRLSGKILKTGFPLVDINQDGNPTQVETHSTLQEIEINKLPHGYFEIVEMWKDCFLIPNSPTTCTFRNSTLVDLIGAEKLGAKTIRAYEGDTLALPIEVNGNLSTHLVQIEEGGKVNLVEVFGDDEITSWKIKNKTLFYQTKKGVNYQLNLIKRQNGIDRAFVVRTNGNSKTADIAPFLIIREGRLPSIQVSEVIGDFLPIYGGAAHTSENQEPYFFKRNGVGGFDFSYYDGTDFHVETNFWSWNFDGMNRINAKRYVRNYYDRVTTEQGVLECAATPKDCKVNNDRTYIVLKKSGNRYTMLRLFEVYFPEHDGEMKLSNQSSSLWVMDKL